ncbi:hypothetical protein HDU78_011067, partial [Chytriomyces hyalinus]
MGKASMQSPFPAASTSQNHPVTPQTCQKPVKSLQVPKKVKVVKSTAKIVPVPEADVENNPPAKETTDIKMEKTVSLHGPANKAISTLIESAKIVLPNVQTLDDWVAYR